MTFFIESTALSRETLPREQITITLH